MADVVLGGRIPDHVLATVAGLRMRVHVDEPRGDDESLCLDDAGAGRVQDRSDRSDGVPLNADVCDKPRVARAIDDATAANDEIEHGCLRIRPSLPDEQCADGECEDESQPRAHDHSSRIAVG